MKKIPFIQEFRTAAGQLNSYAIAGDWMRLAETLEIDGVTLTAADAARWADAGYLPGEATPLIRGGVTPQTAGELDQLGTDLAGGHEQRAMQIIDDLVDDGVLVHPTRVRQQQDPNDPTHVIVHIHHDDDPA